eukprot:Opistho-2@14262
MIPEIAESVPEKRSPLSVTMQPKKMPHAFDSAMPGDLIPSGKLTHSSCSLARIRSQENVASPMMPLRSGEFARPRFIEPLAHDHSIIAATCEDMSSATTTPSPSLSTCIGDAPIRRSSLSPVTAEECMSRVSRQQRHSQLRPTRSLSGDESQRYEIGRMDGIITLPAMSRGSLSTIDLSTSCPACHCDPRAISCTCGVQRRRTHSDSSAPSHRVGSFNEIDRMPTDLLPGALSLPVKQFVSSSRSLIGITESESLGSLCEDSPAEVTTTNNKAHYNGDDADATHSVEVYQLEEGTGRRMSPSLSSSNVGDCGRAFPRRRKINVDETLHYGSSSPFIAVTSTRDSPVHQAGACGGARQGVPVSLPSLSSLHPLCMEPSSISQSRDAIKEVEQRIRRLSLGALTREMSGIGMGLSPHLPYATKKDH